MLLGSPTLLREFTQTLLITLEQQTELRLSQARNILSIYIISYKMLLIRRLNVTILRNAQMSIYFRYFYLYLTIYL